MEAKAWLFAVVSFFHDLFTVIWMGGLLVTVMSYLPALKDALGNGPQTRKTILAFQKRQSVWVYISMGGLILTGLLMSKQNADFVHLFGFGDAFSTVLSIKHILVVIMIGLTLYRSLFVNRPREGMPPKNEKLSFQLLLINAGLAVAVLFTSGLVAALAKPFSG